MKAITVRQPWAWAIAHAYKDVENRSSNIVGSHRGPVAIHVSQRPAEDYIAAVDVVADVTRSYWLDTEIRISAGRHFGSIVAVADIVSVHRSIECDGSCSLWADPDAAVHIVLAAAVPLEQPVPCRGALGLWTVPADVERQVNAALKQGVS